MIESFDYQVGTGLGPTLEFYALVSRELQRFDLELWRGEAVQMSVSSGASSTSVPSSSSAEDATNKLAAHDYVHSLAGLFPLPCSRSLKAGPLAKIRSKFRFVGKFIAKAIMDSRMVCLFFVFHS